MAPAERAALDQGAGQHTERRDRRDLARQIDLTLRELRRLLSITPGKPEAGGADWQVDQEDQAPADQRDQHAAYERARGQRGGRACSPDADRAAARLRIGIRVI